jgi:hypothetical protein
MRAFSVLTLGISLIASAAALPGYGFPDLPELPGHPGKHDEKDKCLSKKDAKEIVAAYTRLIGDFSQEDVKYLADDFSDWSQSINTFVRPSPPFEGQTFNKESFIAAQSNSKLPKTPITVESQPIVDCNQIAFVWSSTFGKGRPARGITILDTTKKGKQLQIKRIDVEFNSLTWAYNLGGNYCIFGHDSEGKACTA